MVKPFNISKIIEAVEVKAIFIALAINTLLSYWISPIIPDAISIGASVLILSLSAYYLSGYFSKKTVLHAFFIGTLSFMVYLIFITSLNLISESLAVSDIITSAIIFGLLNSITTKILVKKK